MSSKKITGVSDVWNKFSHKLFVYVLEAKDLAAASKDGSSDPCLKLTMGKATFKGKVFKKTLDPVFSDLFFFVDPDDMNCRLEVWDTKKGKFLGQCDVCHLDTMEDEKVLDVWMDLQPRPKKKKEPVSGKVHVRAYYSKAGETLPPGQAPEYKAFFHNYIGQFKTGDLILYSGVGVLPALTKVMTGCPYSHVGLVVEMPNRWTKLPELYVVELFRNPDNYLDVMSDKPRHDINMFRLFERFYQFYGTSIWYLPLKEPMSPTGVAGTIDFIQTAYSDPQELWDAVTSYDSKLHSWVTTMFGAKYFTEFDFIDFYSGSFITECLRIAELVPNGTTKASSPLTVASYPCYGEAHVIRPHDPNDIARLQKSSSSTSVVASSSNYTSPSDPSWNMNLPTIRPQKGGGIASRPSFVEQVNSEKVVLRIFFEGFPDLTMATMSFAEGTTAGEFREGVASKKQLEPRNMKIFECLNNMETLLEENDTLNISCARNADYNYQIKVRFDYVPETSENDEKFDGAGFQDQTSLTSLSSGPSMKSVRGPSQRKMIVDELSYADIVKFEKLGSGAFGSVWRVGLEGFTCAMKVLTINEKTDIYDIESLKMETDILEKANHKNIVRYLGHEFKETEMCLFLEYVPYSLRGCLDSMKPDTVNPAICKKLIIEIAKGINYMHNMTPPIIHRDIKSANILCTKDQNGIADRAKICDFGVSKLVDRDNQAQTYVGTLAFMAPEIRQGRGKKVYTTAVDSTLSITGVDDECSNSDFNLLQITNDSFVYPVYSFGIVIWEILTLQMPHKISKRPEWSGPEFNPLYDLQAQCCKANPAQRPTAKQIVDVLALMYNE